MLQIIQFKIQLAGIEPAIWRRITLPASSMRSDLHTAIQAVMGWHDSHLHMFVFDGKRYGVPDYDWDSDDELLNEASFRLDILLSERREFLYIYDFGDDWRHEIVVEEIRDGEGAESLPMCIAGERSCPPEDCGGPYFYPDFLEALSDPSHEDHDHYVAIHGEYDPEQFDLDLAQKRLKVLSPTSTRQH